MNDFLRRIKVKLTQNIKYEHAFRSIEDRLSVLEEIKLRDATARE